MKYFLPDSQDLVDPSFDFTKERRSSTRQRQRDDLYAHELFSEPVVDGILVSKGIVDGFGSSGSRYTLAQRQRLLRCGAREFFRTDKVEWGPIPFMGDCGAFTYVREEVPPYSVDDVVSFYSDCGFQFGISVDHVILEYNAKWGVSDASPEMRERQRITLSLARDFHGVVSKGQIPLVPLGVAQGWSPASYAHALKQLQKIGYQYIAVGGMVPLKTHEILASLEAMNAVRRPDTKLHLLGVTRIDQAVEFGRFGVASLDSTSPLRQAFKDDKDNYYTPDREFTAIRIPQVEANPKLSRAILSGQVPQDKARSLERQCLDGMAAYDRGALELDAVLDRLEAYEELCDVERSGNSHREVYRETLVERPWKRCACDVCKALGHHVILFRGAERNRRRGLHNTWVFYRRLHRELGRSSGHALKRTPPPAHEVTI